MIGTCHVERANWSQFMGRNGEVQRVGSRVNAIDVDVLTRQRSQHPGWRLLRYEHAAFVVAFLHRVFIVPNERSISQARLTESLDDKLHAYRQSFEDQAPSRTAHEYLADWVSNDRGWLRSFYPEGDDEPAFDLTSSTEQAVL